MLSFSDLQNRQKGIGGSDLAGILGISKWATPLAVYLSKVSPIKVERSDSSSIRKELGNLLEPWIMSKYVERTGYNVTAHPPTLSHSEYPFMRANIDGVVEDKKILVELKSAFDETGFGDEFSADIPFPYLCQVMHYMAVCDLSKADLFVFFKSSETFKLFHVERSLKLEAKIIKKEKDFWENHVLKQVPPEPVCIDDFKLAYPESIPSTVFADFDLICQVDALKEIKKEISGLKKDETELKFNLMKFMGENEVLSDASRPIATWTGSKRKTFDSRSFKVDHPDLYKDYLNTSFVRTFRTK